MSTYEIVAVVRPDLDEEALGAAIARINQRIVEHGGTVTSSERWGKRRTAYSIQKYRDGYYVLTIFTLEAGQVAPLRQTLALHEDLLRFTVATHHVAPAAASPQAPAASAPAAGPGAGSRTALGAPGAGSAPPGAGSATAPAPTAAEAPPPKPPSEGPHV